MRGPLLQYRRLRPAPSTGVVGVPYFQTAALGIVVANRGYLRLLDEDLQTRRWQLRVAGTSKGLCISGDTVFYGPCGTGAMREFLHLRLRDGAYLGRADLPRGAVAAATETTVAVASLTQPGYEMICYDKESLGEKWRRPGHPGKTAQSAGEKYLTLTDLGLRLDCLDAATGELLWQFEPPGTRPDVKPIDRANRMGPASPSFAVAGDRVIVTTLEPRVYALSLQSGEVLAAGKPPFGGWFQVTDTSVFFAQPFGLSEFDHREMKEVDRLDYRNDVTPLYGQNRPSLHGFVVTPESVVWTTMHGAFMGVSRRPGEDGRRRTWVDEIPGAIMPIGRSPVAHHGYVYYAAMSLGDENVSGLYAYTGASEE